MTSRIDRSTREIVIVFTLSGDLAADDAAELEALLEWESDRRVVLDERGYRAIAHDRRGHGRSGQPWNGNDMDAYADDLAAVIEALDLKAATLVALEDGLVGA